MQVSCPGCKRVYKVDESALPEKGKKMRCPKCAAVFMVTKQGASAEVLPKKTPPIELPKPAAPPKTGAAPRPPIVPESKKSADSLPKAAPPPVGEKKTARAASDDADLSMREPLPENDFSDIRIPSVVPIEPSSSPDLDARGDLSLPSVPSLDPLSVSEELPSVPSLDPLSVSEELPSVPSLDPLSVSEEQDVIDLSSISALPPAIDLGDEDEDFDFIKEKLSSLPPALGGLPEETTEDAASGLPSLNAPALQTIPPAKLEKGSDEGEIDFGPTIEKSGTVRLDEDSEFDLNAETASPPVEGASLFEDGAFGRIDLPDEPAEPPQLDKTAALSTPPLDPSADFDLSGEAPGGSAPPADSYEAPFAGMPSPEDLEALADDSPPLPEMLDNASEIPSRVDGSGGANYGEINLSPEENAGALDVDNEEFDAFPVESAPKSSVQSDLDLAADPMSLRTETVDVPEALDEKKETGETRGRSAFKGRRRLERQSRKTRLVLLGLLVAAVLAGASLSFTSYGPFGANILFRMIPKPVNEKAVAQARKSAEKKVRQDTFPAYAEAIRETEAAYKEYPGSDELKFFFAYLCYMSQIRFGQDKKLDAKAEKILDGVAFAESKSPEAILAKSAQYFRFSRPVPTDATSVNALKKTSDGLVLLTEVYLKKGDTTRALETAKKLDASEDSPRSGYLLARVFAETGDKGLRAQAASRLSSILQNGKEHVDAALLSAELMLSKKDFDAEKVRKIVAEVQATLGLSSQQAAAHAVLAELSVIKRNYSSAEKEIASAEKLNPENVSMLISKGRVALARKDWSTADLSFSKAAGNAPRNIWAKLGKIETEIRSGELAESKKSLLKLLPENKDNARARYLMGEIHVALKEYEEAQKELNKAIELDDTLLEAYVSLSSLYLALKRNDDAMKILDRASQTVPGSPLIKKTLAEGHAARGDWASAVVELDNALKIDSDDVEAHFQMAVMYRKMDSVEDAKRALSEVEARNPNYPGLALEQGLVMEQTGDVASALSSYKKALSLSPNDTGLKLRVGVASFLAGDFETAEKRLKEVLEKKPASPEANFYYGETLRKSDRAPEALSFLSKACNLAEDNVLYHLRYGAALEEMQNTQRALSELQKAIDLDPKTAEAYILMGKIRLRHGEVRKAAENLERGLALDPSLGDGYLAAAQAYEQLSDMAAARKFYRKAADARPDNPEVHYRFGLAALQTHGKGASLDGFAKAVALTEKTEPKPEWFFEALYRRGVAERAKGMRSQAIATFKRYLKEAPESALDRSEVVANLTDMGEEP